MRAPTPGIGRTGGRAVNKAALRPITRAMMGRIDDGPWPGVSDTSGMTSRLMLAYAEREGGQDAVAAVLEAAGVAEHAELLLDERSWFPFAVKIRLFEAL